MSDDLSFMGTYEEAQTKFLSAVDAWTELRRPVIGTRATLKKIDAREHEARFQLANAAALMAWHMRAALEAANKDN
jgi:hypothetical protein